MARKKMVQRDLPQTGLRSDDPGFRDVESRKLVTYHFTGEQWGNLTTSLQGVEVEIGNIVRIYPPATATDEEIASVRALFSGAFAIQMMPRAKGVQVLPGQTKERKALLGTRATVMAMVNEVHTRDRKALADLAEQVMGKVGI